MQYTIDKNIEIIRIASAKSRANQKKASVWLTRKENRTTGKMMLNGVCISADVVSAAAWKVGDRVELGKVKGANIWVFVPAFNEKFGYILRAPAGNKSGALKIGDSELARQLYVRAGEVEEFDAWADDCAVYFKPKQKGE